MTLKKKSDEKLPVAKLPKKKLGQKLLQKKKTELYLESSVVADIVAAYLYAISAVDDDKDIKGLVLSLSPVTGKYQVSFTEEVNKKKHGA